jgi:hypothetical protein
LLSSWASLALFLKAKGCKIVFMEPKFAVTRRAPARGDFDVLANCVVVGRIFKVHAAPVGSRSLRR